MISGVLWAGADLNLRFSDFRSKNEKIRLGSARRFLQNLRIPKFSGEIENFFARDGLVRYNGRTGVSISL